MYGFSQGGQTSIWAASLAAAYAPELRLLGIAAVAPAARHLDLSFYDLGIPANAGYFITRMAGLSVGYPHLQLTDILTPAGLAALDAQAWGCYEIFAHAAKLGGSYARREALQPGRPWRVRLEENDRFLPLPTGVPILILMGDKDIDVPVGQIRDLRRDLCAQKARVEYREFAGVDHMQMNTRSADILADWLEARFRSLPAPVTCGGGG
jgi:pimeloyl-ACP methyl ester carboxylesterase